MAAKRKGQQQMFFEDLRIVFSMFCFPIVRVGISLHERHPLVHSGGKNSLCAYGDAHTWMKTEVCMHTRRSICLRGCRATYHSRREADCIPRWCMLAATTFVLCRSFFVAMCRSVVQCHALSRHMVSIFENSVSLFLRPGPTLFSGPHMY